jgi:hypothetical protein
MHVGEKEEQLIYVLGSHGLRVQTILITKKGSGRLSPNLVEFGEGFERLVGNFQPGSTQTKAMYWLQKNHIYGGAKTFCKW